MAEFCVPWQIAQTSLLQAAYTLFMLVFVFSRLPEKNAQPGKRLFPSFKRSCMLYMPSQTHPDTNTPINGCSQTPFVPLEFLKKGCHLAQKLLLCHYCVCSIGSPPIPLSRSAIAFCFFFFLSLITGLQKVLNTKD